MRNDVIIISIHMEQKDKGDSNIDDTFATEETTHRRLIDARYKDGYRDGVTDGQEVFLQEGFNTGYSIGYTSVYKVARLRGILWSLAISSNNSGLSEEVTKIFTDLENRLKLAAASCDTSTPSNIESVRYLESQTLEDLRECFLSECNKLKFIDEEFAQQLFSQATE